MSLVGSNGLVFILQIMTDCIQVENASWNNVGGVLANLSVLVFWHVWNIFSFMLFCVTQPNTISRLVYVTVKPKQLSSPIHALSAKYFSPKWRFYNRSAYNPYVWFQVNRSSKSKGFAKKGQIKHNLSKNVGLLYSVSYCTTLNVQHWMMAGPRRQNEHDKNVGWMYFWGHLGKHWEHNSFLPLVMSSPSHCDPKHHLQQFFC